MYVELILGSLGGSHSNEPTCNAEDQGSVLDSMDMSLCKLGEMVMDRGT